MLPVIVLQRVFVAYRTLPWASGAQAENRAWGSACKEDNVSDRKFKIGQTVRYTAPFGHVAAADYKVTQLLPAENDELQYRIKRADEPHERVAKESQLKRAV